MKLKITSLIIFHCFLFVGQNKNNPILNPGFETPRDTAPNKPASWNYKQLNGFHIANTSNGYNGGRSLYMKGSAEVNESFNPFSQVVQYKPEKFKRVLLSAYIKTSDVVGNVGLWCQVWDQTKMVGFQNLEMQNIRINGTKDWEKFDLKLTVDTNVRKLIIGGYLQKKGEAWFDEFAIEDISSANSKPTSKKALKFIDKAKEIVKRSAMYGDSLDWKKIDDDISLLSIGLQTEEDCYVICDYLIGKLRQAGDNHSLFETKKQAMQRNEVNVDGRQPIGYYLGNGIGYLNVPGFTSNKDCVCVNFATKIQTYISDIEKNNQVKGWIVDLRSNTGGNMYPMITGLGPLLDENDTLGFMISPKSKTKVFWNYKKGGTYFNGKTKLAYVKAPYTLKNKNVKIAVLIGDSTASSGEFTAMSFMGQKNVKIFGQESAGYTTANGGDALPDGSNLILAESFGSSRNKKFNKKLIPDVLIPFSNESYLNTTELAKQWLLAP